MCVRRRRRKSWRSSFKWLWEVHNHPATPKSAEEVLRDFDLLLKASQA